MQNHADTAEALFKLKYNCAQAVAGAFCDVTGLDSEQAFAVSSSFGGGFGRNREVCGAVSGGCIVLGVLFGKYPPDDHDAKMAHYATVRDFMERFKTRCGGSYICRELLGGAEKGGMPEERNAEFYKKRPCVELVRTAAEIVDEIISENAK